jgi:hypothetical protein
MASKKRNNSNGTEVMIEGYIALCNRALSESTDRFWYRQAKRLNRRLWHDAHFHTVVYDDHPENVVGEFTLHFDPESSKLSVDTADGQEVAFTWKVPLDYLDDVVNERPEWYLEHPVRLDTVWAAERVRDEVRSRPGTVMGLAAGLAIGAAAGALAVRRAGGNGRG